METGTQSCRELHWNRGKRSSKSGKGDERRQKENSNRKKK
jgi:hypothetical protein